MPPFSALASFSKTNRSALRIDLDQIGDLDG
jgi:hypothetical protein